MSTAPLSAGEKLALVKLRLRMVSIQLTDEQLDFILQPIDKACYLKACPGSGKTEVVGLKAAYEIEGWKQNFSGIAVLSFTKNAAKEITERVKKYQGVQTTLFPHFIGTIDSWLHGYLLHPFGFKETGYNGRTNDKSYSVIENSTGMDFLKNTKYHVNYETEVKSKKSGKVSLNPHTGEPLMKKVPFYANEFFLNHEERPVTNTEADKFHKSLKEDDLREIKQNLNKDGFCTYQDAEHICYKILCNNHAKLDVFVKRFPFLIVDECQDLSQNQLRIFHLLIQKGVVIFLVGDINQSIYEFRRVDITKIDAFIKYHKLEQKLLTKNFRSNQKIVDVSIGLEKYNTNVAPIVIVGSEKEITPQSCILWEYSEDDFLLLPQKFIDHINDVNLNISDAGTKILISKCGILARAHTTLSNFRAQPNYGLQKIELFANALNCWSNNPKTGIDIQNALNQMGRVICMLVYNGKGNCQSQFCPESYTTIEWRALLSDLICQLTNSTVGVFPFNTLTWSQFAGKLKFFLESYWDNFLMATNEWSDVKSKIRAPDKLGAEPIVNAFSALSKGYSEKIRMTTFHDVKGETLDAVLVVSSQTGHSQGGYFEHWLTDDVEKKEHVRFAYVASSRPKHLLIWAIPKKKNNKLLESIKALGLSHGENKKYLSLK